VCGQFLHAAARMGSGNLSLPGLGSFGSGALTEGLTPMGLGGPSSSTLNIAALNPAGSGKCVCPQLLFACTLCAVCMQMPHGLLKRGADTQMGCRNRLPDLGLLNAGSGRLPDALLALPALGSAGSSRPEAVSTGAQPTALAAPVPRAPPAPQYGVVVETGRGEERRLKPEQAAPIAASSPRLAPVIEVTHRQVQAFPHSGLAAAACVLCMSLTASIALPAAWQVGQDMGCCTGGGERAGQQGAGQQGAAGGNEQRMVACAAGVHA
jgi:hypothetical protein